MGNMDTVFFCKLYRSDNPDKGFLIKMKFVVFAPLSWPKANSASSRAALFTQSWPSAMTRVN